MGSASGKEALCLCFAKRKFFVRKVLILPPEEVEDLDQTVKRVGGKLILGTGVGIVLVGVAFGIFKSSSSGQQGSVLLIEELSLDCEVFFSLDV
jgi:hypothetical protein